MCADGEYPGLPCPLVSKWSRDPFSSSWADCISIGGLPLSMPGGLPPSRPGGLPPSRPDASPPRRPWQLPPIGPVEPLFMRPGVPSKGREVSARAAWRWRRWGWGQVRGAGERDRRENEKNFIIIQARWCFILMGAIFHPRYTLLTSTSR